MNKTELRQLSLAFRRVSSNFLNSTINSADINLSRFLIFIDKDDLISMFIKEKISGVEYDFKDCFCIGLTGWAQYNPPKDEACHIKAQYDYLKYIDDNEKLDVLGQALRYCWSDKKYNAIIQSFIEMAFKPLIDYINDQLSMRLIVYDEETKSSGGNTFIQNIDTLNGSANQQSNGVINTYNTNNDIQSIISLIDKLGSSLSETQGISSDEIESVNDDLELVREQLQNDTPKKSRIKKALAGIKRFVEEFSFNLAVSLATGAVSNVDWDTLIQKIETFISNL